MFPFLDLPGEIRNQIYHHLLVLPHISKRTRLGFTPPLYPLILQTCRKVNEEGQQILYGCNVFLAHPIHLTTNPRLRLYYDRVSFEPFTRLIKRFHFIIRLDGVHASRFSPKHAKAAFSGLEELTVEVFQPHSAGSDLKVLGLLNGVRNVEKASVKGNLTGVWEYARWLEGAMMSSSESVVDAFEGEFGEDAKV